jgi:electron-transferring-flavoprotein dehydrogenase
MSDKVAEREKIDVEVLIVGAGPAGLATALRLSQLVNKHNLDIARGIKSGKKLSTEGICVLEKGKSVGSHLLSGAVMDPKALRELLPDTVVMGEVFALPLSCDVVHDEVYFLTQKRHWKLPLHPPFLDNTGNKLISINRLGRWLGEKVEHAGITIFNGFAGRQLLFEHGRLVGVRSDDKGLDRTGQRKANFEPGIDIHSRVTVLAEGSRGSLTKQLRQHANLDAVNPQSYALGVKELWEVSPDRIVPGTVMHTAGWPLPSNQFGGGWLYALPQGLVSVGLVCGLNYRNAKFDPHVAFQRYKTHPLISSVLKGGKLLKYGAKSIPEGGWYSLPPLSIDSALLVGDAAGFLNSQRLKGIHLAIKSGILAAETIFEAMAKDDFSQGVLAQYSHSVRNSWIYDELWPVRNYHQAMQSGIIQGSLHVALQLLTGGRGVRERYPSQPGHAHLEKLNNSESTRAEDFSPDGKLTFDKVTDVFHSGTRHEENQPSHLLIADTDICNRRCTVEYGNPCQYFCPAAVYEMTPNGRTQEIHLNPSNCVHCKTCDIMDPYQIITWVPPEGGDGPSYENL